MGDGTAVVAITRRARVLLVAAGALLARPVLAQRVALLPRPACASRASVPPLAPDTVAEDVLDSLGTTTETSRPGMRYVRNLLAARFDSTASQAQRQAAVDRVCGEVVGGDHSDGGVDGFYLVRLHDAESVSALDAAADALRHMPGVSAAQTLALHAADATETDGNEACAGVADGGELRIAALKEMMASHDSDEVAMVGDLGLGGVDSSAVQVVANAHVCGRVAAAIESAAHFAPAGFPFLVLRAGPRYVAFDPSGINRSFFLVDTTFVFRTELR